jgi:hypothetical protein
MEANAMTKDEMIDLTINAGGYSSKKYPDEWRLDVDDLLRLAKLVAEIERERCARLADEWVLAYPHPSKTIAETIRARGDNA